MKIKMRKEFQSRDKKLQYRTGDSEFKNEWMNWYYSSKSEAQQNAKILKKKGYNVRIWSHILYKVRGKGQREYVLYRRKK